MPVVFILVCTCENIPHVATYESKASAIAMMLNEVQNEYENNRDDSDPTWEEIYAMDDIERGSYSVSIDEAAGVAGCWVADTVEWKIYAIVRGSNNRHAVIGGLLWRI